ncbi:MAG TPA: sulfotransferase [Acetobacteraceae bacterium]|nr:sulfotransferase [Acetobacteraceae bacterium]
MTLQEVRPQHQGQAHRVFHPLAGADLRTLCTVLYRNGGVAPRRAHVAAIALGTAILRLPFTVSERAALAWRLRGEPSLPAPVFIIGHWRSGTTHLANVLSRSPRFGILPPVAVGLPWEALGLARLIGPLIERHMPRDRLIDAVALTHDLPQEDELALANMTPLSFYHGLYFPRTLEANFERGLFLDGCPEAQLRAWARAMRHYMAKMTMHQGGRPLLIRNPVYSARIPLLRASWPEARFIHIYRNPYDVFDSSRRMFATLLREFALQDARHDVDALVLRTYPRLMSRLLDDVATLPAGRFAEIRFETFRKTPLAELERVFQALDLPSFADERERFSHYLDGVSGYQTAPHRLTPGERARVADAWGHFIDRWGYDVPNGTW